MIRRFKNYLARRKLCTKLLLLILVTGIACLSLFRFLWLRKWAAWFFLAYDFPISSPFFQKPEADFLDKLYAEAKKYDIPDSEDDKEAVEALAPFFALADEYTGLYIYGAKDGLYRAGQFPKAFEHHANDFLFQIGYDLTNGVGEQPYQFPLEFKNGYADMLVTFYHSTCFIFPYLAGSLLACVLLFLSVILFFVNRKLKIAVRLEQNILQMSSGDLSTPIPEAGKDELGILASELDHLRVALKEYISREQNLHKSNQDLIAALSHDLRTPLTILKGYLEIVQQNKNPDMHGTYLERCIQKTNDIQEMTGRMLEYALVYDENAADSQAVSSEELSFAFLSQCLKEHCDFLRLAGFSATLLLPKASATAENQTVTADPSLVKRVFNNLFSNIMKYGDKKEAVVITASIDTVWSIQLKNNIKKELEGIESTQIGLKSVQKMMEQMNGRLTVSSDGARFQATLSFPVHAAV